MKRTIINIFLLVVFALLIVATSLPLMTQLQFDKAKRFEIGYRWSKAKEAYFKILSLNPFNADFFAQSGNFLLRQSVYRKDEKEHLKKAKRLYQKACLLNPRYGYYRFLLGKAQLELGNKKAAINNFKTAVLLDPYNHRTNYLVGANLLSVWGSLNDTDKDFALNKLRRILKVSPHYLTYIYQVILYYTRDARLLDRITPRNLASYQKLYYFISNNNLWQYRREVLDKVNFYRGKEEPEKLEFEEAIRIEALEYLKSTMSPLGNLVKTQDWQGNAEVGKNVFRDGNMYWSGTINTVVNIPKGNTEINIQARGTPANGVFPYIIVELDGQEIGATAVDSMDWRQYAFTVNTYGGVKVLSLTFPNDGSNESHNEDRNLFIGDTRIIGDEQQSF